VTYLLVSREIDTESVQSYPVIRFVTEDGRKIYLGTSEVVEVDSIETVVKYKTLRALRNYSLSTLGGLFLASLAIGWVVSGRALRPVRRIARAAAEIQATDLSRRIALRGPNDELRYLADTIDSMLDRLDAAFRAQRQLIDDVSHELRTPLAIIRANLDAVLSDPQASEEDRRRAVAVVDRATSRMTRLVEDLLATARRSASAFTGQREAYLAAGFHDFIAKPFRSERLNECLAALLHAHFVCREEDAPLVRIAEDEATRHLADAHIPAELRVRIRDAASLYQTTLLRTALQELEVMGKPQRALAAHLRARAALYEMDAIVALIERLSSNQEQA